MLAGSRWRISASVVWVAGLVLTGCVTIRTEKVDSTPAVYAEQNIPEELLLDIGIQVFDPGVEDPEALKKEGSQPDIREAEARYIAIHLRNTLQLTGHWGAVRVTPARADNVDVSVVGTIVKSNGKELVVEVAAREATGTVWFRKRYKAQAKPAAYATAQKGYSDPYQDLYNAIGNDLVEYKARLSPSDVRRIHNVAKLKFAADLAPEAFTGYLSTNSEGVDEIVRLPSEADPMLQRVLRVRERDDMFVDTVNEYYGRYYDDMWEPYLNWRRSYLEEDEAKRAIQAKGRNRALLGIASILGAIAYELAAGQNTSSTATNVMVIGGAAAIKSGLDKYKDARIHAEAIEELGQSFGADVAPVVMEVEGHVVKLKGSAEQQYEEWRRLLRAIFLSETGFRVPTPPPAANPNSLSQ